jgi:hypothetical protein
MTHSGSGSEQPKYLEDTCINLKFLSKIFFRCISLTTPKALKTGLISSFEFAYYCKLSLHSVNFELSETQLTYTVGIHVHPDSGLSKLNLAAQHYVPVR